MEKQGLMSKGNGFLMVRTWVAFIVVCITILTSVVTIYSNWKFSPIFEQLNILKINTENNKSEIQLLKQANVVQTKQNEYIMLTLADIKDELKLLRQDIKEISRK